MIDSFQSLNNPSFLLLSAFILDLILGDPVYRLHPVRLIGNLINKTYCLLKDAPLNKRICGILILFSNLLICTSAYFLICSLLGRFSLFFDVFLTYSFIALKDMFDHVNPIMDALKKEDINGARRLLSYVVGRDTERLNKEGIIRACVETIAEGFLDGFFSPIFWFFIGALFGYPVPFMMGYKIINTHDSMLGYKSEELKEIGWASARCDDIVNFIPARISLIFLFLGAILCRKDAINAFRIALRDRLKHSSPNSGHPEAFFAGALGIRLGGPTYYFYGLVDKPWIGDGIDTPCLSHIVDSIRLVKATSFVTIFTVSSFLLTL